VLTHRVGALPEIIRDGVDGFFGDDVEHLAFLAGRVHELDRVAIRASVLERFSAGRMATRYESLYLAAVDDARAADRARVVAVGPGIPRGTAAADELRDRFGEQLTQEAALSLETEQQPPMRTASRRAAEAEAGRGGSGH
jgi:hypothetical protein